MISQGRDFIIELDRIQQLAAQRRDEFEVLRYTLELMEDELPDAQLDELVEHIAAPIIAAIDCKQCANCCRSLDVYLTPPDAARLAEGLLIPVEEIETRYIDKETAAQVEEWGKFRKKPCVFLNGKLCSLYELRPESCRIYPVFTPDFRWTIQDTLEGAGLCPIIYHVLDAVGKHIEAMNTPGE